MPFKNIILLSIATDLLKGATEARVVGGVSQLTRGRSLAEEIEPSWLPAVELSYAGDSDLSKCFNYDKIPHTGMECPTEAKTCFFGTKLCTVDLPFPEKKCHCDGSEGTQKWECENTSCPERTAATTPPAVATTTLPEPTEPFNLIDKQAVAGELPIDDRGCPLEGFGFEIFNNAKCPATQASGVCEADQEGVSCDWHQETCCGKCSPSVNCSCMGGHWRCFYTDACMAPTCYTQEWNLDGATCEKAKETISTVYPGMTTICLKESDPMPTEDDLDRYIVVTNNDVTGLVTDVVFNRNAQCPTAEIFKENKSCSVFGQKCDIVLGTSTRADGSICTQSTRCTCQFGTFFCGPTTESDCAKADPIATTPPQVIVDNLPFDEGGCPLEGFGFEIFNEEVCPPTSPLDSLDSSCTAEGVTCQYGKEACCGNCNASDVVTCTDGKWSGSKNRDCMMPDCYEKRWPALVGSSCYQAKNTILAAYPGMDVYCQTGLAAMPKENDFERYIVVTDVRGIVTNVIFNRNADCSSADIFRTEKRCDIIGQQCSFITDSSSDTASCKTKHTCSCQLAGFVCFTIAEVCDVHNPPRPKKTIPACPALEDYRSGTTSCLASEEECSYTYKSSNDEFSGCTHNDTCRCGAESKLDCELAVECV